MKMKIRLIALLLSALLLAGCQSAVAPNETEEAVTYDWMAGESLIPQQRTGLQRQGLPESYNFESTADGFYYLYTSMFGDTWLLYGDNESNTVIKLCGRADCPHTDSECDASFGGGNCIGFYDGYLYASRGGAGSPRLVRMNPDGTDQVTVMNSTETLAPYGYTGTRGHFISNGVYMFVMSKLNDQGVTIGEGWYYKLDGSMEAPEKMDAGYPSFSGGDAFLCYTNSPNGAEFGGYEAWDPETNTTTYLTDHSGEAGYYGDTEAFYFRDGTAWRLDYATGEESVLFETDLEGEYSLDCFPDCLIVSCKDKTDRNLYIYNWAFELVDTVELDYPSTLPGYRSILGETEEYIILWDFVVGAPRYYIEKSELGNGNAVVHEFDIPDLAEDLEMIDKQIAPEEDDTEVIDDDNW